MTYTAFCENCEDMVSCKVVTVTQEVEVRGVKVNAQQMVAHCDKCGEEVYPNELIDFNVEQAHDAYRDHVGAIRSSRIEELLEKYDIGAEPLSTLLEWGPNTIARQMKHVIPDREHSRRLESLFDVEVMAELVREKGHLLSRVAREKVERRISRIRGDVVSESIEIDDNEKKIASLIPYNDIRKIFGILPNTRKTKERIIALRDFFHVASLKNIRTYILGESESSPLGCYAFRMSEAAKSGIDIYGLAAWLHAGEVAASKVMCGIYDAVMLESVLPLIRRSLCNKDIEQAWNSVVELLHCCGVKVVAVPYVPRTKVNGAVKWVDGNPVITLNARGARADTLWFTLFHEIGHILLHGEQYMDVRFEENGTGVLAQSRSEEGKKREKEADDFSRRTLIPDDKFDELKKALKWAGKVREDIVLRFAEDIEICPDVVVGRLCNEGLCDWNSSICNYRRKIHIV